MEVEFEEEEVLYLNEAQHGFGGLDAEIGQSQLVGAAYASSVHVLLLILYRDRHIALYAGKAEGGVYDE